ncbi:MAG TPA: MBL fold metallo-hydrolase [Solirubrobacteraceae bacterium]|jgi:glyoxylase-like metal-dependent hydrolase (beta-lactamase superfamily II)|nr:MBL fold metallo-hydrolase [Solirubrobacteraceae bacterium]
MSSALPPDAGAATAAGEEEAAARLLAPREVCLVRAPNPGPLTLTGTNTWVVGRDPAWVIDPGPLIEEHLERLGAEIDARGGLGGIVLTHDHHDHSEAVGELRVRHPAPLAAGRGEQADVLLTDGARVGPFEAIATPGHAIDHFALLREGVCFSGDAVLGSGSVFISPHAGALGGYLRALERLRAREEIELICPGHGPLVSDPHAKLAEYVAHRLDRERRLRAALAEGRRSVEDLLDAAWPDVPAQLRPAAAVTLAAHLDKLEEEGALPDGVERPDFGDVEW